MMLKNHYSNYINIQVKLDQTLMKKIRMDLKNQNLNWESQSVRKVNNNLFKENRNLINVKEMFKIKKNFSKSIWGSRNAIAWILK